MTQEQIKDGNRLIAEFMERNKYDPINSVWAYDEDKKKTIERPETEDDYEYDSSWSWLMPVVEKINKCKRDTEMDGDEFLFGEGIIQVLQLNLAYVDIEGAHKQVIKFIEWYNNGTRR